MCIPFILGPCSWTQKLKLALFEEALKAIASKPIRENKTVDDYQEFESYDDGVDEAERRWVYEQEGWEDEVAAEDAAFEAEEFLEWKTQPNVKQVQ